MTKKEAK